MRSPYFDSLLKMLTLGDRRKVRRFFGTFPSLTIGIGVGVRIIDSSVATYTGRLGWDLVLAVRKGDVAKAKELLASGADVTQRDEIGNDALIRNSDRLVDRLIFPLLAILKLNQKQLGRCFSDVFFHVCDRFGLSKLSSLVVAYDVRAIGQDGLRTEAGQSVCEPGWM